MNEKQLELCPYDFKYNNRKNYWYSFINSNCGNYHIYIFGKELFNYIKDAFLNSLTVYPTWVLCACINFTLITFY